MNISPDIFDNTEVAFLDKSTAELRKAKVLFQLVGNNLLVKVGSSLAQLALTLHLPVSALFRWTVYDHFCGGETFEECKKTIEALNHRGVGALLNYGVELKETEEDFDKTIQKNLEALQFGGKNKSVKGLCLKLTGLGKHSLFEKVQSKEKLNREEQEEFKRFRERFILLCDAAASNDTPLYVDAEESWIQDALDTLVEEMMAKHNRKQCVINNTFQLYRWDRLAYLQSQIEKAKAGQYILGAKLVRGAYMEIERERAEEKGYQSPIHENKDAVDKDFDEAVNQCLSHLDSVSVCVASQSEESIYRTMQAMENKKLERHHSHVSFSQLYGMGDSITFNLAKLKFNSTKYLPYGPVQEVIPYLIRRAQENTSVAGQTGRELVLLQEEINRRQKISS
ncbi:MAG: proline dehydrogenase family protein [Bacteroidetes bacterium]|nr:proline dehydrogenase family protein [Bacteroidota bacterium]